MPSKRTIPATCAHCGCEYLSWNGKNQNHERRPTYCSSSCAAIANDLARKEKTPDEERFWSKVDRSGGHDACWPWMASRRPGGYGQIAWKGRPVVASRVAWELTHGEMPDNCVLHKCDSPSCCNPAHLFLGTRPENSADMFNKHRSAWGERSGHAKLTLAQVLEIRKISVRGRSEPGDKALAERFGCSARTIRDVVNRRSWRHI